MLEFTKLKFLSPVKLPLSAEEVGNVYHIHVFTTVSILRSKRN